MAFKRKHFNLVVDLAAFAAFLGLVVTGFILHFSLPPGSGGRPGGGVGDHEGGAFLSLWGLTRHEWGDVHFWIAIALMSVVVVHLFLHWRWIVAMVRGRSSEASGFRAGLGLVGLVAILMLALSPFLTPVTSESGGAGAHTADEEPSHRNQDGHNESGQQGHIEWDLTCGDYAASLGVSTPQLLEALELPTDVAPILTLGDLRAQYGIRGWQIRDAASQLSSPQ